MKRVFLLVIAFACLVSPARASIRDEPVKLRLAGDRPILRPGEPATLALELVTARDAEIAGLEVAGSPLAKPFAGLQARTSLYRDQPLRFDVQVLPRAGSEPLVIRYLVDGVPVEKSLDLAPLLETNVGGAEAEKVSDESRRPVPHTATELEAMRLPLPERTTPESADKHDRAIRVRGRFVYYRTDGPMIGVDGIRVRIRDNDTIPDALQVLAEGFTDSDGWFDIQCYWNPGVGIFDLEPDIYAQFESESGPVRVQTSGLEIEYSWRTATTWDYDGTDLDLGTWTPTERSSHGALHIFTDIRRDYRWFQTQRGITMPEVHVQWPDDGTYYNRFWEEIHVEDSRTWDEYVHGHEYGHHFMNTFSSMPDVDYCNGYCDSPDCGHCTWCEETAAVAYSEGWAQFMGDVLSDSYASDYGLAAYGTKDLESIVVCDGSIGEFHSPWITEGFFAAMLLDIADSANEDDPNGYAGSDALALGFDQIFTVIQQDRPGTPSDFFDDFNVRYPQYGADFWRTASNNTYVLDSEVPGPVVNLHSTTHSTAESSTNSQIFMDWDAATDDWSGIGSHDFVIDRPGALPDTSFVLGDATIALTYPLPPGTYYINVRARDRTNKAGPWSTAGPYVLLQPDPADLVFVQPAGWPKPIVPNSSALATPDNVPYPQTLQGNYQSTYLNYAFSNTGDQSGLGGAQSWLLLDGAHLPGFFNASPAPGEVKKVVNVGPFTVRGGRHYVGGYLDELWQWSELDETNNTWGGPWVWSKQTISWGTRMRRAAPPGATNGWWYVRDPIPLYYSCDGLAIWGSTGAWHVLWIAADDDAADYDLRVYNGSSANVDLGYDVVQGSSLRGPGCLDLMVVNRRNTPLIGWDAGITNSSGDAATYVAGSFYNEALSVGTTYSATLWDSTYVRLFETQLTGGTRYTIRATGNPLDGPFRAAIIDRSFVRGGLSDGSIQSLDSDEQGRITFNIQPAASGYYAFMVYRDPKHGRGSRQILLEVKTALPDMLPVAYTGWDAPLVPRNEILPPPYTSATAPDTLYGNAATTYLHAFVANVGWGSSAANIGVDFELDGANVLSYPSYALDPFFGYPIIETTPATIRGGRHTLTLRIDSSGSFDELDDMNNWWGEQWVWSPLELVAGVPVSRPAPPLPTGGWTQATTDSTLYFNCDGLRTPLFANQPAEWAGVAVMPGAGAAIDLEFHELASGARDGFAAGIGTASWSPGESNYLLVNFAQTPRRALDVGAINANGSGTDYSAEAVPSTLVALPSSGSIGPIAMPAGRTLVLTEVPLTAGYYVARLVPGSGASLDWGLSVHGVALAVQAKADALAAVWAAPTGQTEECVFEAAVDGTYCFAAWKVGGADLPESAEYTLEIAPNVVGIDDEIAPPAATRLHLAGPNPFRARTQFSFDLAREGEVSLDVYDLRGARVRTLAGGHRGAGSHRVAWDGRDGAGRPLAAGVYFVRLAAGGRTWSTKIVLLD